MDRESFKKFLAEVRVELDKKMLQRPYQMNLIDEIVESNKKLDETAHSRIIARLLQFRDESGKYVFLESFLSPTRDKGEWNSVIVKNPVFKTEEFCPSEEDKDGRIDILIEDDNYSLIIENKANDAKDQKHQLGRYIEKVKKNVCEDRIFVLYLPKMDGSLPCDDSWFVGKEDKGYKKIFRERFFVLGFENAIREKWLFDIISYLSQQKQELLKYSVQLYKDYLDSLFNKRNTENKEIRCLLAKYEGDYTEEAESLKLIVSLEEIVSREREFAKDNRKSSITKTPINQGRVPLYEKLSNLYRFKPSKSVSGRVLHIGYDIELNNREYTVYIGSNYSGLFCSIISKDEKPVDFKDDFKSLKLMNEGKDYLYDGYDRDYRILPKLELFFKVMDKCVELQKNEKTK